MYCLKAPRVLRNKNTENRTGTSNCWGNVSLYVGGKARACGFQRDVTLCKKHFDEQSNVNKLKCCFPFNDSAGACKGALIECPQRLFPVFDTFEIFHHTGTYICEGHLTLADKDDRIYNKEEYLSPAKVSPENAALFFQVQNLVHTILQ